MSRLPRIVVPGAPHHVTQRGNRRERIFFRDEDYALYRSLMAEVCELNRTEVRACCLMPNHVHSLPVPQTATGLAKAIGGTHRRPRVSYKAFFQGCFSSAALDDKRLLAAARHVALNPVKPKFVVEAETWPWYSTAPQVRKRRDSVFVVQPPLDRVGNSLALLERNSAGSDRNAG